MKVKDVMTTKVITVKEDDLLKDVCLYCSEKEVSGLPVINGQNKVVGVISEGDLIRAVLPTYGEITDQETFLQNAENIEKKASEAAKIKVKEVMSKPAITIDEDAPLMKAGAIMLARQIKRLPVVKDGKLVGVISRANIIKELYK